MRLLVRSLVALSLVAGLVGALHLPALRKLLARLGGCPAGRVTMAEAQGVRQRGLAAMRGAALARERPALGLALDVTTEAEAARWAQRAGLNCDEVHRGFAYLSCKNVPAAAVGDGEGIIEELTLAFDGSDWLIGVDALRRNVDAPAAGRLLVDIGSRLRARLGEPADSSGEPSAAYLGGGPMRTAVLRWRFSDYVASIVATALPWSGLVIHEQYGSALAQR